MSKLKYYIILYSLLMCVGITIHYFIIWILAFLNNGSVVVTNNDYGEMYPELAFWIILLPCIFYGTYNISIMILKEMFRG